MPAEAAAALKAVIVGPMLGPWNLPCIKIAVHRKAARFRPNCLRARAGKLGPFNFRPYRGYPIEIDRGGAEPLLAK